MAARYYRPMHADIGEESSVVSGYQAPNRTDGLLVAERFYGRPQTRDWLQRLSLALLDRTVIDLLERSAKPAKSWVRADAARWVMAPGDGATLSFAAVCDNLGFNPDYVRRGLIERAPWAFKKIEN